MHPMPRAHGLGGGGRGQGGLLDTSQSLFDFGRPTRAPVVANDMQGTCASVKLVAASSPTTSYLLGTLFTNTRWWHRIRYGD